MQGGSQGQQTAEKGGRNSMLAQVAKSARTRVALCMLAFALAAVAVAAIGGHASASLVPEGRVQSAAGSIAADLLPHSLLLSALRPPSGPGGPILTGHVF